MLRIFGWLKAEGEWADLGACGLWGVLVERLVRSLLARRRRVQVAPSGSCPLQYCERIACLFRSILLSQWWFLLSFEYLFRVILKAGSICSGRFQGLERRGCWFGSLRPSFFLDPDAVGVGWFRFCANVGWKKLISARPITGGFLF